MRRLLFALVLALLAATPLQAQRTFSIVPPGPLLVGDTVHLRFTATDAAGRDMGRRRMAVTCGSLDAAASVDGVRVRGVAAGTARVVCIWQGIADMVALTIDQPAPTPDPDPDPAPPTPPSRVLEVLPESATVTVGSRITLRARLREPTGVYDCARCEWTTSNPAVLAVVTSSGTSGMFEARAPGDVTVAVRSQHPVLAGAEVRVVAPDPAPAPDPNRTASVIFEWCAPQLFGLAWHASNDVSIPPGDSAWARAVALNQLGQRLTGKSFTFTIADTTIIKFREYGSAISTPCGPS